MTRYRLIGLIVGLSMIPAADAVAATPAFPVTVRAANGTVVIKQKPRRIVVLSASATETLFAIGAGPQVIAADDQSNHPASAPRTKLSTFRPNAEAVARYKPDLVITSSAANKLLPALRRLGIPVLLEPSATSIGGAYAQMRQIGAATGHRGAAGRLVARMRRDIAAAVRSVPKARGLSVFHELSPDYFSATSKTFIGRVYALFGFRNIADKGGGAGDFPQLSAEYILAADPDIVVLADTKCCKQTAVTVRERPGWSSISAVRRNRVIAVSDDIASRWGPRIVDFTRIVARVVARAQS